MAYARSSLFHVFYCGEGRSLSAPARYISILSYRGPAHPGDGRQLDGGEPARWRPRHFPRRGHVRSAPASPRGISSALTPRQRAPSAFLTLIVNGTTSLPLLQAWGMVGIKEDKAHLLRKFRERVRGASASVLRQRSLAVYGRCYNAADGTTGCYATFMWPLRK
jgi:hypothetical protein